MTPELTELARSVVALPGWTWPEGMRWVHTVPHGSTYYGRMGCSRFDTGPRVLPDFTDAATAGLLWQMLGTYRDRVRPAPGGWMWRDPAYYQGLKHWQVASCLGEACARVAVSVGRWAGE